MTRDVYDYIHQASHKKPIYQSTKRALKGYFKSGLIKLVENDFEGSDTCTFIVETNEHCRILDGRSKNKFARFNFRDKYSTLSNDKVIECKSFCKKSLIGESEIPLPLIPDEKNFSFSSVDLGVQVGKEKKYFITFKGKVMQSNKPGGLRLDLLPLHNHFDVIVCPMRHINDTYDTYCEASFERSDFYEYEDLMNTEFGFVPGGRQPATYRLIECLRLGVIPVIYEHKNLFMLPFENKIDWNAFSIFIPANDFCNQTIQLNEQLSNLRSISNHKKAEMKSAAQEVYKTCFSDHEKVGRFLLQNYHQLFLRQ